MLLRFFGTQFALKIAHRQVVEAEAALPRPHQIGGERDIGGHPGQPPAPASEVMHRSLGLMQGFRLVLVGQPGRQCGFVIGRQGGGVDKGTLAVGGRDRQRGGIAVIGRVRADHRQTGTRCAADVFGEPGRHCAGFQRAAAYIEAILDLRLSGGQRLE